MKNSGLKIDAEDWVVVSFLASLTRLCEWISRVDKISYEIFAEINFVDSFFTFNLPSVFMPYHQLKSYSCFSRGTNFHHLLIISTDFRLSLKHTTTSSWCWTSGKIFQLISTKIFLYPLSYSMQNVRKEEKVFQSWTK